MFSLQLDIELPYLIFVSSLSRRMNLQRYSKFIYCRCIWIKLLLQSRQVGQNEWWEPSHETKMNHGPFIAEIVGDIICLVTVTGSNLKPPSQKWFFKIEMLCIPYEVYHFLHAKNTILLRIACKPFKDFWYGFDCLNFSRFIDYTV